jgi:hypothetical protein
VREKEEKVERIVGRQKISQEGEKIFVSLMVHRQCSLVLLVQGCCLGKVKCWDVDFLVSRGTKLNRGFTKSCQRFGINVAFSLGKLHVEVEVTL